MGRELLISVLHDCRLKFLALISLILYISLKFICFELNSGIFLLIIFKFHNSKIYLSHTVSKWEYIFWAKCSAKHWFFFFFDLVFNGEAYAPVVIATRSLQLTYESLMYLLVIDKCLLLQNKLSFVQSGSVDFNILKVKYEN